MLFQIQVLYQCHYHFLFPNQIALLKIDSDNWVKTESKHLSAGVTKKDKNTKTVYCPNGHEEKDFPSNEQSYGFCDVCEEPFIEAYMIPYHQKSGNA